MHSHIWIHRPLQILKRSVSPLFNISPNQLRPLIPYITYPHVLVAGHPGKVCSNTLDAMALASGQNFDREGLCQFTTFEEIRQVLVKHSRLPSEIAESRDRLSQIYWTEKFEFATFTDPSTGRLVHQSHSSKDIQQLIQDECDGLHDAAKGPDYHPEPLDLLFSRNLELNLWLEGQDRDQITQRAWSLLKRMPATPPPLLDLDESLLALIRRSYFTEGNECSWKSLRVVYFVPQNLIRLVLHACLVDMDPERRQLGQAGSSGDRERIRVLDATAEFISCCATKSSTPGIAEESRVSWFIVRAYLWSFWQRLKTLHLYVCNSMFQHVDLSLDPTYLAQRNFLVSPGYSLARSTRELSEMGRRSNMCTWILNLVRSEPYCFGLDFDLLHQRYGRVLGREQARCLEDSGRPCNGAHSNNCRRFYGATIPDQSAHEVGCRFSTPLAVEPRLPWNRDSFLQIQGRARAVVISEPGGATDIRYCAATTQTMAISHVWSHGQGGRPEDGINRCLHQRYCDIAVALDCDSYWMDTTCIPNDHKLRREAIMQINGVFSSSRVVLICDRDLMKVDVEDFSTEIQESILAVTLLSDWNARAWTLLESMKGRNSIFLLCKNRRTVNFRDLLRHVLSVGRIDMAVFIWHIYHMLPVQPEPQGMGSTFMDIFRGRYTVSSEIGSLLSYRPASRPGDDFVIWSLLGDPSRPPYFNAVKFWRGQVGRSMPTGYLMSSSERLRACGLSWAPVSPYATTRDQRKAPAKFHRPTDALLTGSGKITSQGILADWLTFDFGSRLSSCLKSRLKRTSTKDPTAEEKELSKIRSRFLNFQECGRLLRPIYSHPAMSSQMVKSFDASISDEGTLVAVCGSNKITIREFQPERETYRWIWKGIHEWPDGIPLPSFSVERGLWIA